jgi:hypothetical protein
MKIGKVINSFAAVHFDSLFTSNFLGGLIGFTNDGEVLSSFWDLEVSGTDNSYGGEGLKTVQMKSPVRYADANWNVDFIWNINNDYPYHQIDKELRPRDTDENGKYNIETVHQLRWISESGLLQYGDYELVADLDMSGSEFWNGGYGFVRLNHQANPVRNFDGNGHSIRNMENTVCLFRENIGLINNLHIQNFVSEKSSYVSGLCVENSGTIRDCSFSGRIHSSGGEGKIVGIAFENWGVIQNITVDCDFHGNGKTAGIAYQNCGIIANTVVRGKIVGKSHVAGCCGINYLGLVAMTTNEAEISGVQYVGGICGENYQVSTIFACCTSNKIVGDSLLGGIAGWNNGKIFSCFANSNTSENVKCNAIVGYECGCTYGCIWNDNLTHEENSDSGKGYTDEELKNKQTYIDEGWNFDFIWDIADSYPYIDFKKNMLADEDSNGYLDIKSDKDLRYLSECPCLESEQFELLYDINLSESESWNGGHGMIPIGYCTPQLKHEYWIDSFRGELQGNSFSISNLKIDFEDLDNVGLIVPSPKGCSIKNLTLENCFVRGKDYVGAFAGYKYATVNLEKCASTGRVSGKSNIGGLAGTKRADLKKCYSRCDISGETQVGGLIASAGNIVNSYFAGEIECSNNEAAGGLAGTIDSLCEMINSFWDYDLAPNTVTGSGNGTNLCTAEMLKKSTYTNAGWDFENIWDINPDINDGYPFFKHEFVSVEDEFEMVDELLVYPNPAQSFIVIRTEEPIRIVKIYDVTGNLVARNKMPHKSAKIDISALSCGVYYMEVDCNNSILQEIFIKE